MRLLQFVLLILVLVSDITIFIWSSRLSKKVFWGQITSTQKQMGISVLSAVSLSLLFIGIALLSAILDKTYTWSSAGVIGVVIVSLILGICGFIGSMWRFFLAGKYRSNLFAKFKKRE